MKAVHESGLTLNPSKCVFRKNTIKFWGMIISAEGVGPDPAKVEASYELPPPKNKEDLKSFTCMMQSNSEFILNFVKCVAPLRDLLKRNKRYIWTTTHQRAFDDILSQFKADALLQYFDLAHKTFIFVDAHVSGLEAVLAQGVSIETAKLIEFVSRSTNKAEKNYPQMDLEAIAVDFTLRRFRQY